MLHVLEHLEQERFAFAGSLTLFAGFLELSTQESGSVRVRCPRGRLRTSDCVWRLLFADVLEVFQPVVIWVS
jgi:hypothetical protein